MFDRFEVTIARGLPRFGKSFVVGTSSGFTLGPITLLKAVLNRSPRRLLFTQTAYRLMVEKGVSVAPTGPSATRWKSRLRREAEALDKSFENFLMARHVSSPSTRMRLRSTYTEFATEFDIAFDGAPEPTRDRAATAWAGVERGLADQRRGATHRGWFEAFAAAMAVQERLDHAIRDHHSRGDSAAAEEALITWLGDARSAWKTLMPKMGIEVMLPLEGTLRAIAAAMSARGRGSSAGAAADHDALALLEPSKTPIGHWLRQRCGPNLRALEKRLGRRGILVPHDALKAWASMQPGRLMSPAQAEKLIAGLPRDETRPEWWWREHFLLTRLLAFLCDLVAAQCPDRKRDWPRAQAIVAERYRQLAARVDADTAVN